jgi:F420-dependent oxidoreductase-like protein
MKYGIHFANFTVPGVPERLAVTLADTAQVAEQGGCSIFTVMDHWFQMEAWAPRTDPMLEAYTTLGFLAGRTERMKLSCMVTGVTYRHPGLLAKTVTTLDVLSGGRAILGIGAGWYEREHLALGVPFPPISERFERLEEALQICLQMWSDDDGPYSGKHYQLAETLCSPPPVQQPRPPILIGGVGERKTLKLVARYADACNLFSSGHDQVKHKLEVLERHCEAEGRDFARIQKTMLVPSAETTDIDAFLTSMEAYAALGIELVEITPRVDDPVGLVTHLCENVFPRLAQIGPTTTASRAAV